jgi:hypothetical protein
MSSRLWGTADLVGVLLAESTDRDSSRPAIVCCDPVARRQGLGASRVSGPADPGRRHSVELHSGLGGALLCVQKKLPLVSNSAYAKKRGGVPRGASSYTLVGHFVCGGLTRGAASSI